MPQGAGRHGISVASSTASERSIRRVRYDTGPVSTGDAGVVVFTAHPVVFDS